MDIKTFIESIQFKQSENHSGIGILDNYYISFFPETEHLSVIPYFAFNLSEPPSNQLIQKLNSILGNEKITFENRNQSLSLVIHEPIKSMNVSNIDSTKEVLFKTKDILKENKMFQPNVCKYCGKEECDTFVINHQLHYPIHQHCLNQNILSHKPPSIDDSKFDSKKLLLSSLGGLVLSMIFAIPSIIDVIYLPVLYTIALILVPLGFRIGYLIGRSSMNKHSDVLMRISGYLIALIIVLWCWYYYADAYQTGYLSYLFSSGHFVPFAFDMIIGAMMVTLGIFIAKKAIPIRKL